VGNLPQLGSGQFFKFFSAHSAPPIHLGESVYILYNKPQGARR
jgi:hypothetical protein